MSQLLADYDLERMKKNGPKDICYCAAFDQKDIEYIQNLNPDDLFKKLEQHDSVFLEVSKADDVVTYPGLSYCMQQIIGSVVTRWRYMAAGSGLSQARPYQQGLESEVFPRADMTVPAQGSATRSRQSLRFVGIFPASFPSLTVRESGVTQAVSGTSIWLTRNVFSSNQINHTAGGLAFTLASLITFAGVTTWG
jgi:hypothetical protein